MTLILFLTLLPATIKFDSESVYIDKILFFLFQFEHYLSGSYAQKLH